VEIKFGTRVILRDVETLDELDRVTAPAPVQVDDLVASTTDVYRVEVVLAAAGPSVEPVLARRP
jgi:hypothetical protein